MKRLWFKKEMKEAILAGKKCETIRNHRLKKGRYAAVSGSRFKAEKFADLVITSSRRLKSIKSVFNHWKEEGFDSRKLMEQFMFDTDLYDQLLISPELYRSRFVVFARN